MASKNINVTLKIWRQQNANAKGKMETYNLDNVSTDSSFLEMLDQLNEQLINERQEPVAFDHDCLYCLKPCVITAQREGRLVH